MTRLIKKMVIDRVDMVDEGSNTESFIKLTKRKESDSVMTYEEIKKSLKEEDAAVIEAELAKAKAEVPAETVTALEKANTDLTAVNAELVTANESVATLTATNEDLAKAKPADEEPTFEDMLKSLPEPMKAIAQKMQDEKVAAETLAKSMHETKIMDEALAKAKEIDKAPLEVEKLAKLLKSAPEELVALLKSMNALITDGAMDDLGKGAGEGGEGTDAWEVIEKRAAKLMADDKTLTKAKAISEVVQEDEELYKRYLDGQHVAVVGK